MTSSNEWEQFFNGHAPNYMQNSFTKNTVAETDFLLQAFNLPPGSHILDMGCGTGRHAVELAKRGYKVTGVDLSGGMLAEAQKAAETAGVDVKLIQANAAHFSAPQLYDAAISICEGAFSLLGSTDHPTDHDLSILHCIHAALKPGAGFILTAPLAFRVIRRLTQKDLEDNFDLVNMTEEITMEWETEKGKGKIKTRQRYYVPTELMLLCDIAGFDVHHVWSGTAGEWARRPPALAEMEMMVVTSKASRDTAA